MGHGQDDGIIAPRLRVFDRRYAVVLLGHAAIHPGVMDVRGNTVLVQLPEDIDYAGVTQIRAIFLERQTEY